MGRGAPKISIAEGGTSATIEELLFEEPSVAWISIVDFRVDFHPHSKNLLRLFLGDNFLSVKNSCVSVLCGLVKLDGKELGPLRFRPSYANQSSELNFPFFLVKTARIQKKEGFIQTPS